MYKEHHDLEVKLIIQSHLALHKSPSSLNPSIHQSKQQQQQSTK
jgi:hypothetical protein